MLTNNSSPYMSNTDKFQSRITPVPNRLADKVAVVTGGARGIGKAIAVRFAQEGAHVIVADKDFSAARETALELRVLNNCATAVQVDVTDRAAVEEMVDTAFRDFKGLDILVNNAGVVVFGSLLDCTIEDWDHILAVDLTGALHCTQVAARRLVEQGRGGRLIHIGSTASILPTPQQAAYSIAKAGLLMMSRLAAMELVQHNITSNLVCPEGAITEINRHLLSDPAIMAALESHLPAGRLAKVEEIAALIAFLASDEAAYITGTEMVHDGGVGISALWWR